MTKKLCDYFFTCDTLFFFLLPLKGTPKETMVWLTNKLFGEPCKGLVDFGDKGCMDRLEGDLYPGVGLYSYKNQKKINNFHEL